MRIWKGAVAPEVVTVTVEGVPMPVLSAVLRIRRLGASTDADWTVDIQQSGTTVVLTHVLDAIDTASTGQYRMQAIMSVAGGAVRSEPFIVTIEDPFI